MAAEGDQLPDPDLHLDDEPEAEVQVDTATLVAAKTFGDVPLPLRVPFWKAAAIEEQASFAQRLDTAGLTIGGGNGGPLDLKTKQERQKEADEKSWEFSAIMLETSQRWSRDLHSFAGVEMTGAQWGELGNEMKQDSGLRRWLIEKMMKDGKSRSEAEAKANEMADVYEALSKPPSQRTPEENAMIARAETDPEFRRYTEQLAAQRYDSSAGQDQRASQNTDRETSVEARYDLFASAPDLTAHHQMALAATEPLSTPKVLPQSAPALAPASAGLEV